MGHDPISNTQKKGTLSHGCGWKSSIKDIFCVDTDQRGELNNCGAW